MRWTIDHPDGQRPQPFCLWESNVARLHILVAFGQHPLFTNCRIPNVCSLDNFMPTIAVMAPGQPKQKKETEEKKNFFRSSLPEPECVWQRERKKTRPPISFTQNAMGGGVPWYHRVSSCRYGGFRATGKAANGHNSCSRQQVTLKKTDAVTCPKLQRASLCATKNTQPKVQTIETWLPGRYELLSSASRALLRTLRAIQDRGC